MDKAGINAARSRDFGIDKGKEGVGENVIA